MSSYGDVALQAYALITQQGFAPQKAWKTALVERYTEPTQLKNAIKHTCPKGAFLGLCGLGFIEGIPSGSYTKSKTSSRYAVAALSLLRNNFSLAKNKPLLNSLVYGHRTPNDETEVVLTLLENGLIRSDAS
jgi:hypothetical protein